MLSTVFYFIDILKQPTKNIIKIRYYHVNPNSGFAMNTYLPS